MPRALLALVLAACVAATAMAETPVVTSEVVAAEWRSSCCRAVVTPVLTP